MTTLPIELSSPASLELASPFAAKRGAGAGETPMQLVCRWMWGTIYALHPKRAGILPALIAGTTLDILRGGTRLPADSRTIARAGMFAGVVRGLTPQTFLAALKIGFFPWCHCGPLKWWTRQKRMVLFFGEHKLEKRTLREMKKNAYTFTFNTAFDEVVEACAGKRERNWHALTWITPRFMRLYSALHVMGHAHSFEIWNAKGELAGGGFGISVGRVFYSESLFSRERDASKMASSALYYHLARWGYAMCDGRDFTPMQAAMGYREISRSEHQAVLASAAHDGGLLGRWQAEADLATIAHWVAGIGKASPKTQPEANPQPIAIGADRAPDQSFLER